MTDISLLPRMPENHQHKLQSTLTTTGMGAAVHSRTFCSKTVWRGAQPCVFELWTAKNRQIPYLHATLQRAGCTYAARVSCGMEMSKENKVLGRFAAWNPNALQALPSLAKHPETDFRTKNVLLAYQLELSTQLWWQVTFQKRGYEYYPNHFYLKKSQKYYRAFIKKKKCNVTF